MENKIVFISGGSKGIGRALVERFSSLASRVIFTYNTDISAAEELELRFYNVNAVKVDFNDLDSITGIMDDVKVRYGCPDVVVANAAHDRDNLFVKMDAQRWNDVIDVNLNSLYYLTQSFLTEMISNGWGRIIFMSSIAGFTGAFGKSNYSASKAGVVGLAKSLSLELAQKNITVNAVAPGAIQTNMLSRIPEKYLNKILEGIPMGRFGRPDEVADLVEFMASEKSNYITGQVFHINGGSYL